MWFKARFTITGPLNLLSYIYTTQFSIQKNTFSVLSNLKNTMQFNVVKRIFDKTST